MVAEKKARLWRAGLLASARAATATAKLVVETTDRRLLIRLTDNHSWGFGLCFLHFRNVKGYGWNHKRVYRIYCELELNLRIKPRRA